ncbi:MULTISPECIES: alpha/beta hydrolase [Bacillus]|uniref:alpha/beta hydrolase n=1 Tax=Bacillus TaxID=1386 RepID=UPI0002F683A6|nr:alpha/beta hydrolase [Bacillus pseudomycoides]MED1596320.1 alpha/beta hydrolase [Bacillus pseudomycoides]MED4710115.1 alpha/beta hydrolase [Bacillus pseudomycoides]OOR54345.1 alpha/beta hydrolase [Bacillus pseudomycoides]PDY10198.1 alpha/beta hydrolase [Bacillus pseudomycoides]PDZ10520.1 alpha/beta hydrolase [Bacillus pseudomycoides]
MNRFVKVRGKKIEVCTMGNGSQTVVIQTGMGCSFYDWFQIAEKLSSNYTVVLFHRPGYGKSELGNEPRTTLQATKELQELLHMLAIRQPIILVGHSYGGLCAQHFAMVHPNQLKALILVDSTSVNLHRLDELDLPTSDQTDSDDIWLQKYRDYSNMNAEALRAELDSTLNQYSHLSPYKQKQYVKFLTSPFLYKATTSELSEWKSCAHRIKQLRVTLKTPLIVIGRDPNHSIGQMIQEGMPNEEAKKLEKTWQELIQEQRMLSQNSRYILAQNASHGIESDRPDIIIQAIHSFEVSDVHDPENNEHSRIK